MMSKIGFIGLGNMGLPMAKNLVAAGHDVTGFDLSDAAKSALVAAGGASLPTPLRRRLLRRRLSSPCCRRASMSARFIPRLRACWRRPNAGALLIDSSTIDVDTARVVSAQAEAAGFTMVDAPVSGGVGGAAAGTLTFMVGGTEEGFAAAKPYLDIMGQNIFHAGGSGNGQVAKICNNMLLGISMIGTAEAFMLGEKLGLDAQTIFRYFLHRFRPVLEHDQLLPRARAGADQPRQ